MGSVNGSSRVGSSTGSKSGRGCFLGRPLGLFGGVCPGGYFGGLPLGLVGGVSPRGYFLGLPLGRFGGVCPRGNLRGLPLGRGPGALWLRPPMNFVMTSSRVRPVLGGESTATADEGPASDLDALVFVAGGLSDARRRQAKVSKSRYHSPGLSSRSVLSAGVLSSSPSTTSSDAARSLVTIVLCRFDGEADVDAGLCVTACRLFIGGCPALSPWGSRALIAVRSTLTLFALAAVNTWAGFRPAEGATGREPNGVRLRSRRLAVIAAL